MKKWTFLAVAGLLAGAAPVFTGCIDNDEPEGISILRGAKAELLKAKAAVEQANAQWVLAQAAYVEAETRWMNAKAEWEEYSAQLKALEVEMQQAYNEAEKVRLEKQMQDIRNQMELAAKQHELDLINMEKYKLETQRNYDLLKKQIEIAIAIGSDETKVTLETLQAKVEKAYVIMYGGTYKDGVTTITVYADSKEYNDNKDKDNVALALETALYEAQRDLVDAEYKKAQGDLNADGDIDLEKEWIPTLQIAVKEAEAKLTAETEALAKLEEFLDTDVETADWRAELDEIAANITELQDQKKEKNLELTKAMNSDSYLNAWSAVYGVYEKDSGIKPDPDSEPSAADLEEAIKDGTKQEILKAEEALDKKKKETELSLEASEEVTMSDAVHEIIEKVSEGETVPKSFSYDEVEEYTYWENGAALEDDELPTELQTRVDDVEKWVKWVSEASADNNAAASAEIELAGKEKTAEDKSDAYDLAVANWEIALAAHKDAANIQPVPTEAFQKSVDKYNELYADVESAVEAYNKAYDDIYNAGYTKGSTDKTNEVTTKARNEALANAFPANAKVKGFNDEAALNEWKAFTAANQTEAQLQATVKKYCVDVTTSTGLVTADAVYANAWAVIEAYIDSEVVKQKTDIDNAGKAAATAAVDAELAKGDQGKLSKAALKEADKAIKDFVANGIADGEPNIATALANYTSLAASPYGQVVKTVYTSDALIGVWNKDSEQYVVSDSYYADEYDKDSQPTGKVVVANTEITSDEVKAATATKHDAAKAETAWHEMSKKAFGDWGTDVYRAIEPTEAEVRAKAEDKAVELKTMGAAGELYAANDAVQLCKDIINSADELASLKEAVLKLQENLLAEIEADYNEAFAAEIKAIDDAEAADKLALEALAKEEEAFADIKVAIAELQVKIDAQKNVRDKLATMIYNNLGIEWPTDGTNNTTDTDPGKYDADGFVEDLQEAITQQQKNVASAEQELAEAKVNLQKAEEGKYDYVAEMTRKRDKAQAAFDAANEAYGQALEDLQTALDILADNAAE